MDFGKPSQIRTGACAVGAARLEKEFSRFGFVVYRIGLAILRNREEAEDLVLDVFTHKAGPFLEKHPQIAADELGYWLHRVAKNLALDRLRARRHVLGSGYPGAEPEPQPAEDGRGAGEECARLLEVLDETDRDILRGKYGLGLSWEEIGRQAGLTLAQARYRAEKALVRLKKMATKGARYVVE